MEGEERDVEEGIRREGEGGVEGGGEGRVKRYHFTYMHKSARIDSGIGTDT